MKNDITLGQLCWVIPGFVRAYIHNNSTAEELSIGSISPRDGRIVRKIIPISPYTVEISIADEEQEYGHEED